MLLNIRVKPRIACHVFRRPPRQVRDPDIRRSSVGVFERQMFRVAPPSCTPDRLKPGFQTRIPAPHFSSQPSSAGARGTCLSRATKPNGETGERLQGRPTLNLRFPSALHILRPDKKSYG